MYEDDNDGRFPDDSPVEIRYPRSTHEEKGDRSRLPKGLAQAGAANLSITPAAAVGSPCSALRDVSGAPLVAGASLRWPAGSVRQEEWPVRAANSRIA